MGQDYKAGELLSNDAEKKTEQIELKWKISFMSLFFALGLINNLG
jgi:hypothetical protein